jgi:hypothetical protein
MKSKSSILFLGILLICSLFLRTYNYKNINFDYDEDATIAQLKSTSLQRIYNYIFLQNLFKYEEINQIEKGIVWHINICFPLFYLPLKVASIFSQDISFFRLIVISFGIVTPVFLFLLGKKYSLQTGIIASVLLLFHPWAQFHSTYIRFYGFWALISTLCLWYVEFMITKIQQGRTTPVHYIILAISILLPCTVHAFGVVSSLLLLCMLLSHFYYHKTDLTNISLANKSIFGITFILLAIIVSTNVVVFAYTVFTESSPYGISESPLARQTTIHVVASALFNFGYLYPIIIVLLILVIIFKKSYTNITLNRYIVSITISLLPTLVIMVKKPQTIRPDYLYGIFPYLLLLTALLIEYLAQEFCKREYNAIFSVMMTLFLIVSTLPTFISNVFIDNDRFDFIGAAKFISKIENANFYSDSPGYFNVYLNKNRVQQILDIDPETCHSPKDEYFFIRIQKGKFTYFFYDFRKLKDAQLVEIIGKDRIDLRARKIYVFFRNCT